MYYCLCCSVLEDEKLGLHKEISDLRSSLRETDAARVEVQRHWQELQRTLKALETERSLLTAKVNDLQMNLTQANDEQEELIKENFALKQKVVLR